MDVNLSEDVLAMIGLEKIRRYDVTRRDIKHFAQATGETNPIYFDAWSIKFSFLNEDEYDE